MSCCQRAAVRHTCNPRSRAWCHASELLGGVGVTLTVGVGCKVQVSGDVCELMGEAPPLARCLLQLQKTPPATTGDATLHQGQVNVLRSVNARGS